MEYCIFLIRELDIEHIDWISKAIWVVFCIALVWVFAYKGSS